MGSAHDEQPDLGAYHNWLYRLAADLLPDGYKDADIDDLVQEGRIAMWKAYEKYDDCKGTLAPWLTNAARMRMKDIAHGHGRWTGRTSRRGWVDAYRSPIASPLPLDELLGHSNFSEQRLRPAVAASRTLELREVKAWAKG